MASYNIVWVSFPKPICPALQPSLGTRQHWFFTSLAAIYDLFSVEQVGCPIYNLWYSHLQSDHPYNTGKCKIMKATAITKKQKNHEQGKS